MGKYKIMSGLMAFIAVFLVFIILKSIKVELPSLGQQKSNLSFESNGDWDNDGLTNREESYWNTDPNKSDTDGDGYLDGEEVVSGHDPMVPGPDDKLLLGQNLTKKLSALTVSGIAEGSLKPDSPSFNKSLNLIVDDLLLQSELKLSKQEPRITIVEDSPESVRRYADNVIPFIKSVVQRWGNRINNLLSDTGNLEMLGNADPNEEKYKKLTKLIESELPEIKSEIDFLQESIVPKSAQKSHEAMTALFVELYSNYALLSEARQDPIQALISSGKIINLFLIDLPEVMDKNY